MKEQFVILPDLPIVGTLKLFSKDGFSLTSINVVNKQNSSQLSPFFNSCYLELAKYLSGNSRNLKIKIDMSGLTNFQTNVLKEMKKIPYGQVASYKELAQGMNSKGYQAIGSACGKNPFFLIYPCHRVLGSKDLGGFAHGLEMKKKLLLLEERTVHSSSGTK